MGFHYLVDIVIVAVIGLAIFGPKALQSVAHSLGKGVAQTKEVKEKIMSDLAVDDITKVTKDLPRVPRNSRQVVEMLMKSDEEDVEDEKKPEEKKTSEKS
jgi:Sec-independent protein translocase protein TatA